MGVPQRGHCQAGQEVEIRLARGVVEHAALAPHEGHRGLRVGVHECGAVDGGGAGGHSAPRTMVPTPSSVNTSRSSACGVRPSRMWARPTPDRTALAHASTLGIIPPFAAPVATRWSMSSALAWWISVEGSSGTCLLYTSPSP